MSREPSTRPGCQGHWGGSNQRAPSGVNQPCWNIERWFFFLALTKWQSNQFHCTVWTGIPAREMPVWYLLKCLISFFQVRTGESISDMHEHICTGLAPSGQTSTFLHHRGMDRPEGPAKSYKQKCQAAPWKRICTTRVQARTSGATRPLSPFLREPRNEVTVSVAPGTTLPTAIPSLVQTDAPHSSEGMPVSLAKRCQHWEDWFFSIQKSFCFPII